MMTKEMIYEEFNIVKNKDAKKKKNNYAHTIAYLQPYWMKQQREEEEENAKRKSGIKDDKEDIIIESVNTIN